jgi:hypothetical protein
MKKQLLLIACCLLGGYIHTFAQTTYYVSSSGSDSNSGTSEATAWKTLNKVSSTPFTSGDQVLFKRGDKFYGQLRVNQSGLTVAAYGIGAKPILTGEELVTTPWSVHSGDIYKTILLSPPIEIRSLFRADSALDISRFPNKDVNNGYLNFESVSGRAQFTDNELTENWDSSEVVVRGEKYRLIRTKVLSQSGGTINIVPNADIINLVAGRGYFFRNNIKAVDKEGEWAFDSTAGVIYLQSSTLPTNISYAKQDSVVVVYNADNVTIRNLQIEKGSIVNMYIAGGSSVQVDSCNIFDAGGDALYFNTVNGVTCTKNVVRNTNWNAVTANINCSNVYIHRNDISNVGNEAFGKSLVFYGVFSLSAGAEISNNKVDNTVGIGILVSGANTLVKRNYVTRALTGLEDYGAIYTNYNLANNNGLIIEENIVSDIQGEINGAPPSHRLAMGIYLDNNSSGVIARNNSVDNVAGACFFVGTYKENNLLQGNTAFNGGEYELYILNVNRAGVDIKDNIFISNITDSSHKTVYHRSSSSTINQIGEFSNNYIGNPFFERSIKVDYQILNAGLTDYHTPYSFNIETHNVFGNSPAPFRYSTPVDTASAVLYFANPSDDTLVVTLPIGNFVDAKGVAYSGTVSIAPYASFGLFKYFGPISATCTVPTGLTTTNIEDYSAVANWNAIPDVMNYDVRYKSVDSSKWVYSYNVVGDTSFILKNLVANTNYEWQVRASCYGNETAWTASQLFSSIIMYPKNIGVKELMGTSAIINWTPAIEDEAYQIRYKLSSSGSWITIDSTIYTEAFVAELTPASNYVVSIRSKTDKGWSAWSDTVSFTTTLGGQINRVRAASPNHWLVRTVTNNEISFREHSTALFVGRSTDNQCGIAVFPIQLPTLAAGQTITGSDFFVRADAVSPLVPQVWGMPYRNTADYNVEDYYDGHFAGANQANATLLQSSLADYNYVLKKSSYNLFLANNGHNALTSYLNNQYTNGAVGGKWAFIRINPTVPSTSARFQLDRTEDGDSHFPQVTFILSPLSNDLPNAASITGVNSITATSFTLTWEDLSSNEIGFVVERRGDGGYFRAIDTLAANTTSYSDSGLAASTKYYYRILAYNNNGAMGYSNEFSVKTSLGIPTNLSAKIKANTYHIQVSWTGAGNGATGFLLERKNTAGVFGQVANIAAPTLNYVDSSVSVLSLPYIYRVRAYSEADTSGYSNEFTVTSANFENIVLYQALSSVNGSTSIPATYTNTLASNVLLGNVPVFNPANLSGGCPYAVQANFQKADSIYSPSLNTYMEFKIKPSTLDYKLKIASISVKARKAVGEAYTIKYRIAYKNQDGIFVDNGIDLNPTPVACSAAGYGTNFVNLATQTWDMPDFDVTDTINGVTIRVYYFNQPTANSMGLPLVEVSGSVQPVPDSLKAPTNLQAVIKTANNKVNLTWNDPNRKEIGYLIERKTNVGTFNLIDTVPANATSYVDLTSDVNELPYTYRLRAYTSADTSVYSEPIVVTTNNYEVITLYKAVSSTNGSASSLPTYTQTVASQVALASSPAFNVANITGGCYYSVQAVYVQADTAYSSGLNTYMEFRIRPTSVYKLDIKSIAVKARKAVGAAYTSEYRIAYSNAGGAFVDNGYDLVPTAVGCNAAGFGANFDNLSTQSWNTTGLSVTDTTLGVRVRIYYFNQTPYASLGLPYIHIEGSVIPVVESGTYINNSTLPKTMQISLESDQNTPIKVYPNPISSGQQFKLSSIKNANRANVRMLSSNGTTVPVSIAVTGQTEISIRPKQLLAKGLYTVQVINEGAMSLVKVIVQ